MRKNNAFVAKIVNTHLTKGFMAIFAPAESLPSPATLTITIIVIITILAITILLLSVLLPRLPHLVHGHVNSGLPGRGQVTI